MQKKICKISNTLSAEVSIKQNPYAIPIEDVFSMAARDNPKREYLFVSKLIGKHIAVNPNVPLLTGFLLASRLAEYLDIPINCDKISTIANMLPSKNINGHLQIPTYDFSGKALFLGFAETATALGHAVFEHTTGNVYYLHTTREDLDGWCDTIHFTEDHCHCTEQRCAVLDPGLFDNNDFVVLIDDEITTGNLALNIIRAVQEKFPQKHYIVLTILDWRSTAASQKYAEIEKELGIKISVISLLAGNFTISKTLPDAEINNTEQMKTSAPAINIKSTVKQQIELFGAEIRAPGCADLRYLRYTGRFGINKKEMLHLKLNAQRVGEKLRLTRKGKKTLCLGTGEFMYIPFCIAKHMGEGVSVQSTTRSPVHPNPEPDYAVKQAITFYDPVKPEIKNFVYNIPPFYYDEIYIFWERETEPEQVQPLVAAINELGISNITFISHVKKA